MTRRTWFEQVTGAALILAGILVIFTDAGTDQLLAAVCLCLGADYLFGSRT